MLKSSSSRTVAPVTLLRCTSPEVSEKAHLLLLPGTKEVIDHGQEENILQDRDTRGRVVGEKSEPYRRSLRSTQSNGQARQRNRGASRARASHASGSVADDHHLASGG